ncbi:MAG: alpha/beta hydrolase-fold protein [Planctomycetota bacterium]
MNPLALPLVAAALAFAPALPQEEVDPPKSGDLRDLLDSLYEIDRTERDARKRIDALLEPFAAAPAPTGSDRKKLWKDLDKRWKKGRELPGKGGEYWYWEEEDGKRGRFFISGKRRKPKGLFIGLHGGGVGSADATGALNAYRGAVDSRQWLGIFPQAIEATERGWTDSGTEQWIMTLIEEARRTFDVPPDRIYIGGHSMGGYGSWVLGAHHADVFAAAVPSAGAPSPIYNRDGSIWKIQTGVVPNLRNLPMCVFQSTDDPKVPPDVNQFAVAEVEKAKEQWGGYDSFEYWEVDDRQHSYPLGGTDALLERIEEYERNPRPDKVVWQPTQMWKTTFYWLDWPKPRIDALIVAELDRSTNSIAVTSDGQATAGLGVLLSEEIVDMEKEVVVTLDGEEVFRGVPVTSWSVFVRTALDVDEGRVYSARIPLKKPSGQ